MPLLVLLVSAGAAHAQPTRISLEDAMRTGANVSYSLAAAGAGIDAARANVTVARSGYLPQITITASYLHTIESEYDALFANAGTSNMLGGFEALPFGRDHTWRAGIDAQQLIWDGGKVGASVKSARAGVRIAKLDESSRRAVIVLTIADAYASAVLADKLVGIGEASLALAEKTLEQAKLGFEQGSTAEFDVVRAEVTRDTQRTAVLRTKASRDLAMLRVKRLLQLPLAAQVELTTELTGDVAPLATGIANVAPKEQYAVARARATVTARDADVRAASSTWFPQISAFTSYGRVDYPTQLRPDNPSDWRTNWTAGVNVSLPVFTGFRRGAQIKGAKANRRAAEALLADTSAQADLDLRTATTNVEVATATLQSNARSVDLARRAYQIADVRYRQGVSTYLELSDARIALDRALGDQASAARDLQVARVRLALFPALPPTQGTP